MKATIIYTAGFTIPKNLPHAQGDKDDQIFGDSISVRDECLQLDSNRGNTKFYSWIEKEDHYEIPFETYTTYNGAWRALNAVQGITFPECMVGQIESTYGRYQTLADYEFARNILDPLKHALVRSLGDRATPADKTWLTRVEPAIGQILDLNDPCRNPIIPK